MQGIWEVVRGNMGWREKLSVNSVKKQMLNICHMFTVTHKLGEGDCEHSTKNHKICTKPKSIEAGERQVKKMEGISPRR